MTKPVELEQLLRDASMRVTIPRLAVLTAVSTNPHADTDTILAAVRSDHPGVSHQAVYDSLKLLTQLGALRKIQPHGLNARYETRVGDNHHHLVCRSCGTVLDVDCSVGNSPCLHAANEHGFTVDEAEVIYWGLCTQCQPADSQPGSSPQATPGRPSPDFPTP